MPLKSGYYPNCIRNWSHSFRSIGLLALLLYNVQSVADVNHIAVIQELGCDVMKQSCQLVVDKKVGSGICYRETLNWMFSEGTQDQRSFDLLVSAYSSGNTVEFTIVDECDGSYPTFTNFKVSTRDSQ